MPIEFDCPHCTNRLRTPDGTEGRTAKCPNCSALVEIPHSNPTETAEERSAEPPVAEDRHEPAPSGAPFNPYSSPYADTSLPDEGPIADLSPTQVTASEILSTSWRTFRDNLLHFFLLGLVLFAFQIGGQVVSLPLGFLMGVLAEAESIIGVVILQIVNIVWSQLLGTFCTALAVRYSLNVIHGSREPMRGAFNVLPFFLRLFFGQILVTLLVYSGGLLVFVPFFILLAFNADQTLLIASGVASGVVALLIITYIWTRLLLTFTFIIDRDQGIIDAMSSSFAYTKGNSLAIFLAFLAIVSLTIPFVILTCFLGAILAWPYVIMTLVVVYQMVTGQSFGGKVAIEAAGTPPS